MMIIGCDLHTRYQQIAMLDMETGEEVQRRLEHENGEARAFYSALQGPVRVGIEATGHTHWFEALLAELGQELWMGDAAKIRACVVRAENGRTGRGAPVGAVTPGSLSPDLAAVAGGAGSAAIGLASAKAGVDAGSGEEPTARAGDGRGSVPQEETVHRERTQGTGEPGAGAVGQLSTAGIAADVR